MKRILLTTTSLVLAAGIASADVSISGVANVGLKYTENGGANNNDGDTIVHNEIDFNIVATGESDNGITFGASVDLDASEADQVDTQSGSGANDPEVFFSMNGLTVTVGAVGSAGVVLNTAEVGFDGLNTNFHVDNVDDAPLDNDVHVSYAFGDYTVAASMGSDSDDTGVSLNGSVGDISFGVGFASDDSANTDYTSIGLGYSMDALSFEALFVNTDANGTKTDNIGLSVSYTMDALTVAAAMSDSDANGADAAYGIGASYDLGGGLAIAGGVGSVGDNNVADLGLSFAF